MFRTYLKTKNPTISSISKLSFTSGSFHLKSRKVATLVGAAPKTTYALSPSRAQLISYIACLNFAFQTDPSHLRKRHDLIFSRPRKLKFHITSNNCYCFWSARGTFRCFGISPSGGVLNSFFFYSSFGMLNKLSLALMMNLSRCIADVD